MGRMGEGLVALAAALVLGGAASAQPQGAWTGSWAAAQQIPEPNNALPSADLTDATLRQIVHLSVGGPRLRVRFSNAYGAAPLHITAAHVARPLSPAGAKIDPASDRALTFGGRPEVIIPAGADYLSDPVALPAAALSDLAVSLHLDAAPAQQTGHPGSRATSYVVHGDLTGAADLPGAKTVEHWYLLSGVETAGPGAAVVAFGDSITDGHGATTNGNDRWPDVLARRLQADPKTRRVGVLNVGIGGNRLLNDGLGPNALARFDRDVLARPGARWVIVLEGVNDLGTFSREHPQPPEAHAQITARLEQAYAQMIARAHAQGVKVIGATITPYGGSGYYHPDALSEADRQAINAWIRAPGRFDGVVDFDAVIRDPARPDHIRAAFDSGDGLHPSPAGYRAMADAIPLSLFAR